MFYKDETGNYRTGPLDDLLWLEHGFGSRHAPPEIPDLATLHQIHSSIVIRVEGKTGRIGEGDALITNRAGIRVGVRTADCLPIFLADEENRAIAAVHAGWRGTLGGIVVRAVESMRREFNSRPADLHAAIGPGIGGCCYEVGSEVAAKFRDLFPERTDLGHQTYLDLEEANRRLLVEAGVRPGRIYCGAPCTRCTPGEFHSWRRDGQAAGRMISYIGIRL